MKTKKSQIGFILLNCLFIILLITTLSYVDWGSFQVNQIKPINQESISQTPLIEQPSLLQIQSAHKLTHQSKLNNKTHQKTHSKVHIEKPTIDKKEYEYVQLGNCLKVLLIHDEESKMTSAALNVNVGSWSEPNEFPGLAHFLEHMLFQGSHTYPKPNYFQQLVAKGGGYTNAYTQGMRTNYYFTIESSKSQEALDVFAHFFIDPLLSKDMVEKEANAVNSEYEINVNGDGWKIMHLLGLMSDPSHPLSRFTIGNLDSLVKPNVVDALKKFHEDYYSSNQMALVIRSNIEMDQMIEYIKKSEFKNIPNKNIETPSMLQFGVPIKELGQVIKYHLNKKSTRILYVYQIQDGKQHYLTKPIDFINSMVKSRHEGGLYHYLVSKKLALNLGSSSFLTGNGVFQFYIITVELERADQNNKNQALVIGQAIISYFDLLIKEYFTEEMNGNDKLKKMYENKKNLADVQFQFMEEEMDIFKLSHNLNTYPPEFVLNVDIVYKEYNPNIILNYLADFIDPNNMMIMIGDDNYKLVQAEIEMEEKRLSFLSYLAPETMVFAQQQSKDLSFIKNNEVSQYNSLYHLEYEAQSLQAESLQFLAEDDIEMKCPEVNGYIPTSLEMKSLCHSKSEISYIQHIDSQSMYDRNRQNIFLESKHKMPFYFTSVEECKKHEFEYEGYNHFPMLIQKNLEGKTWWRLDRAYSPSVYVGLNFDTALDLSSVKRTALLNLFNSYVSDSLLRNLQPSFEAGYDLSFDSSIRGISLVMYGWSDKFDYFYKNVLQEIRNPCDNQDQLERIRTKLIQYQSNAYEQKLSTQVLDYFLPFIMVDNPTPSQMIEELQTLDTQQLLEFQNEILQTFRFTSYFTGNILRDEVQTMTKQIHEIFDESASDVAMSNHLKKVSDLSHKSIQYVMVSKSSNDQDNNGITLNYYQIGSRTKRTYSLMTLISKSIQNAAFGFLRTELQLGYIVNVRFRPVSCIDTAQILVQGTAQPPYIVNQRIEEFLRKYRKQLEVMTEEQFEDLKKTNIAQLNDQDKYLKDKATHTWRHIKFNDLAFEEKEVAAAIMESLKKEELLEFYDNVFKGGKLSLQVYGKGMIKDTLKQDEDDFLNSMKSETMKKSNTYASRDEITVLSKDEFAQNIRQKFNCNYRISNI